MKFLDYKSWNIKKIVREIAIMGLIIFVVSNALSYIRKPDLQSSQLPTISAPLSNGEVFNSNAFKNRPLMIHFWATWCPVCKREAGNIQTVSEYYNVLTIAVKSGSNEEINRYLKEQGVDYRVINDINSKWANLYSVGVFPTTFIYNAEGTIAFTEVGYTSTLGLLARMWWAE